MKLNSAYYCLKDTPPVVGQVLGNVRSVILPDASNQPIVSIANDYFPGACPVRNDGSMSYSTAPNANKFLYNNKEEQEMPGRWLDYGFRFYDSHLARFHAVDPHAENYYYSSPFTYVLNNPLIYIDPNGKDTLHFIDVPENPENRRVYTADIIHIKNGKIIGTYKDGGSTYPNYPDTKADNQNTIDEGEYEYNNELGHGGDRNAGINLVDEAGNRVVDGKDKDGNSVKMTNVNVHSGVDPIDNAGRHNRGSAGCPTICPTVAPSILPQLIGTTGKVIIQRNKKNNLTLTPIKPSAIKK